MLDLLSEYGLFLAKTVTWVVAVVLVMGIFVNLLRQSRDTAPEHLEIHKLNDRFRDHADTLNAELLPDFERKRVAKARRAEDKARRKRQRRGADPERPRLFVLDFQGDAHASDAEHLRNEITAILQVAREHDEVLLRLESAGGYVHDYGLAASQLARLRARGLRLTVAVDKVAASGGYLMASVADRILAAPFAVVGSIGVVGQLPNFHRLLRKHDIDYELHTAGEFKRTLTLFAENSDEARAKFREELEEAHALFKGFLTEYRPRLAVDEVATGEHWFGSRALDKALVDEIRTSDDYLLARVADSDVFEVHWKRRLKLAERLRHAWMMMLRGRGLSSMGTAPVVMPPLASYTHGPASHRSDP